MKCGEGQGIHLLPHRPPGTTTGNLIVCSHSLALSFTSLTTLALCPFSCCSVSSVPFTDTCLSTTGVGWQRHGQAPPLCMYPWYKPTSNCTVSDMKVLG